MLCIRLLFLFHLSFAFDWDEAREHQAQADRKKDYVLSRIDMSNFTVLNATAYKEALHATNWAFRAYYRTFCMYTYCRGRDWRCCAPNCRTFSHIFEGFYLGRPPVFPDLQACIDHCISNVKLGEGNEVCRGLCLASFTFEQRHQYENEVSRFNNDLLRFMNEFQVAYHEEKDNKKCVNSFLKNHYIQ